MRLLPLLAAVVLLLGACGKKTAPPPTTTVPPAAKVTGIVAYRQRIALPPNAIIEVTLEDVSRADAPGETLGRQEIRTKGKQSPYAFAVPYTPSKIRANHRYVVRARITVDGQLAWISDTSQPVLTLGHGATAEIVVKPARATK